ncbi:hypothetical protein P9250_16495 [Caballeronia sp. LP006]|jgi:hypothetical protein|uniref:hypothetical protein n=1 Tax=unclassified Caballeronia TaxID=2646786 RepID=UPI001FD1CF9F|nr:MULTISPECIES: hypothetical protein [unclassified Caballeronia]MDR5829489.1 hypothetical protein [Caballeronia sp. LP006]
MTRKLGIIFLIAASLAASYALARGFGTASRQCVTVQMIASDDAPADNGNSAGTSPKDKEDSPLTRAQD